MKGTLDRRKMIPEGNLYLYIGKKRSVQMEKYVGKLKKKQDYYVLQFGT
jgi:hypothetical protein